MFSGKSDELIRLMTVARIGGHGAVVVKPARDTRVGAEVRSRNGGAMDAIVVECARDMLGRIGEGVQIVGIDEAQFFGDDLVDVVKELLREGKRVYVAGLVLDYAEHPFVPMATLMALANECRVLTAICQSCKNPNASRTKRTVQSTERHLVGDGEAYEPRCLACYYA